MNRVAVGRRMFYRLPMANFTPPVEQIIDLERYPLDRPQHPDYEPLLTRGRDALERDALFAMPGFLRPGLASRLAAEIEALLPQSTRYQRPRNAYTYVESEDPWPPGHPRRCDHACAYHQVLNYQIRNDSLLRRVYYWQPLAEFLRRLCGYESFYRSDCPHLALSAKIAGAGDTDGWHYDSNDVVFSLLLQAPAGGGVFEYAPFIRSETRENYDAVAELFADPARLARRPPLAVGGLTVFKGDLSMHRVTPVEGPTRRIVALFCYDREAGTTFDQDYIDELKQGLPGGW